MRKYYLFILVLLLFLLAGCVGLIRTNAIRGSVFTDEYIETLQ